MNAKLRLCKWYVLSGVYTRQKCFKACFMRALSLSFTDQEHSKDQEDEEETPEEN